MIAYDGEYRGRKIRVVALQVPCGGGICTVQVAETTNKRSKLARNIVLSSLVPELLITLATLAIVWFGVQRGLAPLADLSAEIRSRSARDLRPIDPAHAPEEARPLVGALNQLFRQVAESSGNQQRFLANAAHQLRTPLAGLRAHTEIALAQGMPEAQRAQLEQVHRATIRTARLANQLLALARAEPGGYRADAFARVQPARRGRGRGGRMGAPRDGEGNRPGLRPRRRAGAGRRAAAARGARQPDPQRARVHAARRPGDGAHRAYGTPRPHFSRSKTTGRAFRRPSASRCWSASTARREPPAPAAGLACRSCARSRVAHGAQVSIGAGEGAGGTAAGCKVALTFAHG